MESHAVDEQRKPAPVILHDFSKNIGRGWSVRPNDFFTNFPSERRASAPRRVDCDRSAYTSLSINTRSR
jgi:hypothetical protein